MKSVEKYVIEQKVPQTTFSWNYIIYEDSKNKIMKIYTKDIFKNSKLFKIDNNNNKEEKGLNRKKEKRRRIK